MKINEVARNTKNEKVANLKHFVITVIKNLSKGLFLSGPPGVGKSTIVADALREAGITAAYAPHHVSPLAFYGFVYANRDKLIVCDDSANNMNNRSVQAILKAMTWPCPQSNTYTVSWQTKKSVLQSEGLPSSFEFTGQIVTILNGTAAANNDHVRAIESRLSSYYFDLNFDERMVVIAEIAKPKYFGLTESQMEDILGFIVTHAKPGSPNFDLRLLNKLSGLLLSDPNNWTRTASALLEVDPRYYLLQNIIDIMDLAEYSVTQQADVFRKWGEQRGIVGCGRSTFFNLMKLWFKPVNDLAPDQSELKALIQKEQSKNPTGSAYTNGNSFANSDLKTRRGRPPKQQAIESKNPATSNTQAEITSQGATQ